MKKKCAFLVSILLCISMVMTNFAGLGNSIIEAKADGDSATIACPVVKVTVNNNQWGTAGVSTGEVTQTETESYAGNILQLKATALDDDVYFDQWSLTGAGTIENVNYNLTNFTVGAENATIQAIFKEKKELNYTVEIDNWAEDEDVKEPIVKDASGNQVLGGIEYGYYLDEDCLCPTTPANSGAEDSACAPKKAGKYYVKVWIYPETDQYKIKIVTIPFSVLKRITITLASGQDKVTYAPGLVYELSKLFIFPDEAGTRTYEIANDPNDTSVGKGTLNGSTLTVEKAGPITIKVTTAQTDTVVSASAEATLTVNPAKITSNMLNLAPDSYIYVPGATYEPVLSVYDGQTELIINKDYEIVTTKSDTSVSNKGDYKITVKGIGNYTDEEASIPWKVYEIPVEGVANNGVYTDQVSIKVSYADLSSVTLKKDSNEPSSITIQNGVAETTVTDVGSYVLTITDKTGNSVEYKFSIVRKVIEISVNQVQSINYEPGLTYDVSTLFEIPDVAGTPSYEIANDPNDTSVGKGTLNGSTLTVEKAGPITIKVTTAQTDTVASASAEATLTVNPAKITSNMLNLAPDSYIYVLGATYEPVLSVYDGETQLKINKDYVISDTSITSANNIGKYTIYVTGIGNYKDDTIITWNVIDETVPVISGVKKDEVYYNEVKVKVNDDNLESVMLKKDSEEPKSITIQQNGVSEFTVTELGTYNVTAKDKSGNESTCVFYIEQQQITIQTNNKDITYDPNSTYKVDGLFNIPNNSGNIGNVVYEVVDGEGAGTGIGTLSGNNTLTITKAGTIKIHVVTSGSKYVAKAEAYAILTVNKAEVKDLPNLIVNDVTYGTAVTPVVENFLSIGSYEITYKGADESTNYSESTLKPNRVGKYTATLRCGETENYKPYSTSVDFSIKRKELSDDMFNLKKSVFEYIEGQMQGPTINLSDSSTPLIINNDYTFDTSSINEATAIGTYTIIVNGIGNYTGAASVEWKIIEEDDVAPIITGVENEKVYCDKVKVTVTDSNLNTIVLNKKQVGESSIPVAGDVVSFDITDPGDYTIIASDLSGHISKCSFVVLSTPVIKPNEGVIIYTSSIYDVSGLFKFPDFVGQAKYSIVTGDNAGTGRGTLEGQLLTITNAGTIKINVITAQKGYVATGSAIGVITGKALTQNQTGQQTQSYTITVGYNTEEGNVNNANISYSSGSKAYLKATPNKGYVFLNWTENGNEISKSEELEFTVTADRNLKANFLKIKYELNGSIVFDKNSWKYTANSNQATVKVIAKYKTNINDKLIDDSKELTITGANNQEDGTISFTPQYTRIDNDEVVSGETKKYYINTGKPTLSETEISEDGSIVIVGLEEVYYYTGKAIKPSFIVIDKSRDAVLAKDTDYTVSYKSNKKVGKATVTIKGKGNYKDTNKVASFEIKDLVAKAKAEGVELEAGVKKIAKISGSFVYNGLEQYPASINVTLSSGENITLTHEGNGEYSGDKKVIVTICNNVDKGTATVAVAGADGKYKTANFKINVADFGQAKPAEDMEGTYSVKGVTPDELIVYWENGDGEEVELVEGQDFKAEYTDNKAAGTGTVKLTGKGNFKGTLEASFTINPYAPKEINAVGIYAGVTVKSVKVTVLDGKGFALNQKKQLEVSILDENGDAIAGKTKLTEGQKCTVVVKSKDTNNITIDEAGLSTEYIIGGNLGKAKVDAKKLNLTYTGKEIELTDEQIGSVTVTYGKAKTVLVNNEDFEIVGYTNNVKKGTMTVTIQGTGVDNGRGVYSGYKTFKVKIMPSSIL